MLWASYSSWRHQYGVPHIMGERIFTVHLKSTWDPISHECYSTIFCKVFYWISSTLLNQPQCKKVFPTCFVLVIRHWSRDHLHLTPAMGTQKITGSLFIIKWSSLPDRMECRFRVKLWLVKVRHLRWYIEKDTTETENKNYYQNKFNKWWMLKGPVLILSVLQLSVPFFNCQSYYFIFYLSRLFY